MKITKTTKQFSLLFIITIYFSKIFYITKSDWVDYLEVWTKRDIIFISNQHSSSSSSISSDISKFLKTFQISQLTFINYYYYYSKKLQNISLKQEKFVDTMIIISNISIIQNYSSLIFHIVEQTPKTKVFILIEDSYNINTKMIEQFAKQQLPDLTDVFFGNKKNLYGLSCIKNICISMESYSYLRRRKTFQGVQLKLAMVKNWENLIDTNSNDSINVYKTSQEINSDLLTGIQFLLNFSTILYSTTEWAILYDNGSWDGMAKLVDSRKVDVGLSRTYILPFRVKHFRFLVVVYSERLIAYYHPSPKMNKDFLAVDFDLRIWFILIVQIFITGCLLKLICGLDIFQAILIVIGTTTQQGLSYNYVYNNHWSHSSRMLSFILNISGLLIYIIFSALLVSNFSIEANVIKNLEDLFKRGYSFGILHDSYLIKTDVISQTPKNTALGQIISNLDPVQKIISLDGGTQAVLDNEKFAFLSEVNLYSILNNLASNQEICNGVKDLAIEEEKIKSGAFVMKDSPYAEYFNFAYLIMWERGMTSRFWKNDIQISKQMKPSCAGDIKSKLGIIVDMRELNTAFLIAIVGILLSLLALCLEKILSRVT